MSESCRNGHPRTAQTTYIAPNGKRACRTCRNIAHRRLRQTQSYRDWRSEYDRTYYLNHRESKLQYLRQWRLDHREYSNEYQSRYYAELVAKAAAYDRVMAELGSSNPKRR